MPSDLPIIVVRLPKDEKAAIEKAAAKDARSVSTYVRLLVSEALKKVKKHGA
jgi:hypothetical protein